MDVPTGGLPNPSNESFSHLRSPKSSFRLDQIEKIRANGLGELVALPQLVICGDQSAGKSSVLEGITGIPFPRQEGLCTRFPTDIILRNDPTSEALNITASIRPHLSRSAEGQKRLSSYRKVVGSMSELPLITEEVSKLMDIRGYTQSTNGVAFASDVLRIEITGPTGLHLSVVDLPGLISVANEEQSEEDVDAVYNMVTTYLQSSRAIILAVLQASNDMANQGIIKLARKYDPQGQRTVGVITKPDLINQGTESRIALVAKNQGAIKLKLGFFLVKNPSPMELKEVISVESRSGSELQFFSTLAWKDQNVDPDRVGVDKLRLFLQDLLDTHIERELPKVQDEIKKRLAATETELEAMGSARPTIRHIRSFITSLSMRFYRLFQAALDGSYDSSEGDFFSQHDDCRLRARTQELNTIFASNMRTHGQKRRTSSASQHSDSDDKSANEAAQLIVRKADTMQWVKDAYIRTRGRELPGNFSSALISALFHEQSQPWYAIAQDHIDSILEIVSQWVGRAVEALIPEEGLRGEIDKILTAWLENSKNLALEELHKLVKDERGSPMTYNHYYTDNIQKYRLQGQKAAVMKVIGRAIQHEWHGKLHISNTPDDMNRFISAIEPEINVDMDEQACEEAITQLNAYYKVAMKTFVDNVARQVIERHIMSRLPKAFCPDSAAYLSDEELLRIGSEPEHQRTRRNKLSNEAEDLRRGLCDLQKTPSNF